MNGQTYLYCFKVDLIEEIRQFSTNSIALLKAPLAPWLLSFSLCSFWSPNDRSLSSSSGGLELLLSAMIKLIRVIKKQDINEELSCIYQGLLTLQLNFAFKQHL